MATNFKLTSKALSSAYYLKIPNKGWNADLLFYFDKEENVLKQARFQILYITLKSDNRKIYTLRFETAEKDGTIEPREIAKTHMAGILENFFGSEEDYKNTHPLRNDYKYVPISDWLPILIPFKAKMERDGEFGNDFSAFRYKWENNNVVRAYFDVPTEYVYTPELGLTPLQPFVCPSDTYPTIEECRNSVKINVYRFGEKPKKKEPKTFYIIAINGMAKEVNEDTYKKIKGILEN